MKNLIKNAIDLTMNSGADACDILVNTGESINLSSQTGKLDKFKISKTSILGIRVIKNKKIGLAYSESFNQEAILFASKSALENAHFSDVNEHESIEYKNSTDFIQKTQEVIDTSTMEEKIDFTLKLESEIKRKDQRVSVVPYNSFTSSKQNFYYQNSLETYTEENRSYISAYTSALLKTGDKTSTHAISMMGLTFAQLDLDQCVDEVIDHASSWLEATPVPTGKYDVIFDTDSLASIMEAFSSCFSAKDAIQKINPWESKLHKSVAAENFTLIDSPFYQDALFKYHVDHEGIPRKDLVLIENGILNSFYHNTSTAKYFGTTTTGHASRDPKSSLNVSSTNWIIKPGLNTNAEVTDGVYLEIIDLMGLHSGCDSISGEFSLAASGYLCKDGKRIQPVKGITVAGNFNKLLCEITRMGNELKSNSSRSTFSPLIRFGNLAIAGK